jgi:predicted dienelactone hydrolase
MLDGMQIIARATLLTAALAATLVSACGGSERSPATPTPSVGAGLTPPQPSGSELVGFERLTPTDRHRSESLALDRGARRIPIRVWYPAAARGAKPGSVLTRAEQAAWEKLGKLSPGSLDGLGRTTTASAPAAGGRHPVLLLSHGLGETTALLSAQAADLASHGYVVVGIDHAGDSAAVDVGGGHLVTTTPRLARASERSIALRARDMRFVLGRLGALRGAGRLDLTRVGAFGHSNGGATAASAMLDDRRLRAGVDLDGAIFGRVVRHGLDRPFGIALGDGPAAAYQSVTSFRRHLRGPRPFVRYPNAAHHSFTDMVWLTPQLHLDPAQSDVGTVDPAHALRQQSTWLMRFFDRHLRR